VGEYTRFDIAAGSTRCTESECPVTNVSWTSTQFYIDWLNRTEPLDNELNYRLCKEAEWEYAARAETSTKWSCGNDHTCLDKHAWYGELVTTGSAHPVKTKEPNPWGLYDIHGNVDEWVEDQFCSYKYTIDENAQRFCPEPTRAIRGGNFLIYSLVNSSLRKQRDPGDSSRTLGLRLCASRE
jgi:formylglycine-generating enzyme required for sulfatase activity